MAYGIEVLDVNGKTVFNSINPTELVVWKGSVAGGVHLAIPDYCYGWDTTVFGNSTTATNIAGIPFVTGADSNFSAWTDVYQIIFPWNPLVDYKGALLSLNTGDVYFDRAEWGHIPVVYGVVNGSYVDAYVVWRMNKDVSAIRGTAASRTITPSTTHQVFPSIYARPVNPTVTPVVFAMKDTVPATPNVSSRYNRGVTIADKGTLLGSNTFEIVVAVPAKDWGGVLDSRVAKHTTGVTDYGLEVYTDSTQQHHSASTVGQFITYSTRSRPTQFSASATLHSKEVDSFTPSTTTPFPTLTAATTPYKRYCRMNPTRYYKGRTRTNLWTYQYAWWANHSIGLQWNSISGVTIFGFIWPFTTYTSQQLYGIVDFGAGM